MASQKPIRVGLIGLTAHPNMYDWAAVVHLAYIKSSPLYELTAICNTSLAAAHAALAKHSLPPTVAAYVSAEDLANDPNVDLVVVAVRAPKHKELIMPSLLRGKSAFVEWPLGRTLAEAEEMAAVAREKGCKTVVGLQARQTQIFKKVKELVGRKLIGRILSTTVTGTLLAGGGMEDKSVDWSLDGENGTTIVDVHFPHFIEGFSGALGEIASLSAVVATQRPTTSIIDNSNGGAITANVPKPVPDQILVQGKLESGAVMSIHFRGGMATLDKGFRWLIYGEEGEIEITGWAALLHINVPGITWSVKVSNAKGERVESEEVGDVEGQPAVGRVYDAFAEGNKDGYADFEHGVLRQREASAAKESSKEGKTINLR